MSWKLGGGGDAIARKPPKADVPPVGSWRSCLIVAVTLHFEVVVSGGKVADLQRVGILSSLGEFSILRIFFPIDINSSYCHYHRHCHHHHCYYRYFVICIP